MALVDGRIVGSGSSGFLLLKNWRKHLSESLFNGLADGIRPHIHQGCNALGQRLFREVTKDFGIYPGFNGCLGGLCLCVRPSGCFARIGALLCLGFEGFKLCLRCFCLLFPLLRVSTRFRQLLVGDGVNTVLRQHHGLFGVGLGLSRFLLVVLLALHFVGGGLVTCCGIGLAALQRCAGIALWKMKHLQRLCVGQLAVYGVLLEILCLSRHCGPCHLSEWHQRVSHSTGRIARRPCWSISSYGKCEPSQACGSPGASQRGAWVQCAVDEIVCETLLGGGDEPGMKKPPQWAAVWRVNSVLFRRRVG